MGYYSNQCLEGKHEECKDRMCAHPKCEEPYRSVKDKVLEILEIDYVSPHAPMLGKEYDQPRCGDCWCTDQSVHTHATMSYLVKAEKLIDFIRRELL